MNCRVFLLIATSLSALAAAVSSSALAQEAKSKNFSMISAFELSSNMRGTRTNAHESGALFSFTPSYVLGRGYSAKAALQITKDLTGEQKTKLFTSDIGLSHSGWKLNPTLNLSLAGWASLPLTFSVPNTSLIIAPRAVATLSYDFTRRVPVKGFYQFVMARPIHKYTTTAEHKMNNQYVMVNRVTAGLALSEKWSLDSDFRIRSSWTYNGVLSNSFIWAEGIGYSPTEALSFSAGFSNEAGAYKANGYESNIALFSNTTQISGSVTYTY